MENQDLVDHLIRHGYLRTPRIIQAFRSIDRKLFVLQPEEAYEDYPLPIHGGQTISAPHMVAIMLEILEPKKTDVALEIGSGSGYNTALLGFLTKKVFSIEFDEELASFAKENLKKANIKNASIILGDGSKGLPGKKFNKIIFTCAVREIPLPVIGQLKDPGILLAPVGGLTQDLIFLRKEKGHITKENHGGVVFVPMREK